MAGDLSFFLAVDAPDTIRLAAPTDLARWRLVPDQAWARGIQNVKRRMGQMQLVRFGDADGPSGLSAESGLAPSALADPALCGPDAPIGMDGQVVLIVSRDTFLFAMPSDAGQTRRFWTAAKRAAATGAALSSTPLTCRARKWVVATAP